MEDIRTPSDGPAPEGVCGTGDPGRRSASVSKRGTAAAGVDLDTTAPASTPQRFEGLTSKRSAAPNDDDASIASSTTGSARTRTTNGGRRKRRRTAAASTASAGASQGGDDASDFMAFVNQTEGGANGAFLSQSRPPQVADAPEEEEALGAQVDFTPAPTASTQSQQSLEKALHRMKRSVVETFEHVGETIDQETVRRLWFMLSPADDEDQLIPSRLDQVVRVTNATPLDHPAFSDAQYMRTEVNEATAGTDEIDMATRQDEQLQEVLDSDGKNQRGGGRGHRGQGNGPTPERPDTYRTLTTMTTSANVRVPGIERALTVSGIFEAYDTRIDILESVCNQLARVARGRAGVSMRHEAVSARLQDLDNERTVLKRTYFAAWSLLRIYVVGRTMGSSARALTRTIPADPASSFVQQFEPAVENIECASGMCFEKKPVLPRVRGSNFKFIVDALLNRVQLKDLVKIRGVVSQPTYSFDGRRMRAFEEWVPPFMYELDNYANPMQSDSNEAANSIVYLLWGILNRDNFLHDIWMDERNPMRLVSRTLLDNNDKRFPFVKESVLHTAFENGVFNALDMTLLDHEDAQLQRLACYQYHKGAFVDPDAVRVWHEFLDMPSLNGRRGGGDAAAVWDGVAASEDRATGDFFADVEGLVRIWREKPVPLFDVILHTQRWTVESAILQLSHAVTDTRQVHSSPTPEEAPLKDSLQRLCTPEPWAAICEEFCGDDTREPRSSLVESVTYFIVEAATDADGTVRFCPRVRDADVRGAAEEPAAAFTLASHAVLGKLYAAEERLGQVRAAATEGKPLANERAALAERLRAAAAGLRDADYPLPPDAPQTAAQCAFTPPGQGEDADSSAVWFPTFTHTDVLGALALLRFIDQTTDGWSRFDLFAGEEQRAFDLLSFAVAALLELMQLGPAPVVQPMCPFCCHQVALGGPPMNDEEQRKLVAKLLRTTAGGAYDDRSAQDLALLGYNRGELRARAQQMTSNELKRHPWVVPLLLHLGERFFTTEDGARKPTTSTRLLTAHWPWECAQVHVPRLYLSMFMGRNNFPVGYLDNTQRMHALLGDSGCGKSLLAMILIKLHGIQNVGAFAARSSREFPLEHLVTKMVSLCTEGATFMNISLPEIKGIIAGDLTYVNRKGRTALNVRWRNHLTYFSNEECITWVDATEAMHRRYAPMYMLHTPAVARQTLEQDICSQELPMLRVHFTGAYHWLRRATARYEDVSNMGMLFHHTNNALINMRSNPVRMFINECMILNPEAARSATNNYDNFYVQEKDFRDNYKRWLRSAFGDQLAKLPQIFHNSTLHNNVFKKLGCQVLAQASLPWPVYNTSPVMSTYIVGVRFNEAHARSAEEEDSSAEVGTQDAGRRNNNGIAV